MRLIKAFLNNRTGVSAIEFALVGPVFFVMMFGLIEFSLLFLHKTMLTHSVQETIDVVRAGNTQCYSPSEFRDFICENHVLAGAETCNNMAIRQLGEASWPTTTTTGNTNIEPLVGGEVALFQVDYPYSWYTPYIGALMGQGNTDTFTIHHSELFRNEYFLPDTTCAS